jgi:hypothetical protein
MGYEIDGKTGKVIHTGDPVKPEKPRPTRTRAPTMEDMGIKTVNVVPSGQRKLAPLPGSPEQSLPKRPVIERMMPEPEFKLAEASPAPALPVKSAEPIAQTPEGARTGLLDQAEMIDMLYEGKIPPLQQPVRCGHSGRPIEYSKEVADRVLILATKFTLPKLVKLHKTLPSEGLVRVWILDNVDGFAERWKRARRIFLEGLADEVIDLSDDSKGDEAKNFNSVQRSKLKVESRMWLLSKLKRDLFGNAAEADPAKQVPGGTKENNSDARERLAHLLNRAASPGRKGGGARTLN